MLLYATVFSYFVTYGLMNDGRKQRITGYSEKSLGKEFYGAFLHWMTFFAPEFGFGSRKSEDLDDTQWTKVMASMIKNWHGV